MAVALDTNILVYRSGFGRLEQDRDKTLRIATLLETISSREVIVVPGQVLGETYNVLTKRGVARDEARDIVQDFAATSRVAPASESAYASALGLAVRYKLQFWDALVITTAAEAGCGLLLSEDMQDGFTVGGLTVANPFAPTVHPRLAALL